MELTSRGEWIQMSSCGEKTYTVLPPGEDIPISESVRKNILDKILDPLLPLSPHDLIIPLPYIPLCFRMIYHSLEERCHSGRGGGDQTPIPGRVSFCHSLESLQ